MNAPRPNRRRGPIVLASLAVLLVLGLWVRSRPAPVPVDAQLVVRGPLRVEVSTNGTVEPLPDGEVRVHARLPGRIVALPEPGTRVETGDVILHIDEGPVLSELAAAGSERVAALESLRAARKHLEMVSSKARTDAQLFEQGALTRERFEEGQAELADARARLRNLAREVPLRVSSLELRMRELEAQRDAAVVKAPFSGTIYRTAFREGDTVRLGEPILWLAELSRLRVRANVDQVDLGRVRVGQSVRITANAFPGRVWSAVIEEIVPHVVRKDNRAVSESLALVAPPTDGLIPGMTVDVDVLVDDVADVLRVSPAALHTGNDGLFVFRIDGGRVRRTPVMVGRQSVAAVEVVSGLEPDDRVVVGATDGLEDGSRVRVRSGDVAAR